jgi:NCS1 family nucleobase:cation symporter-1
MSDLRASALYNPDLAPVERARRTWGTYNYAALWLGMSVQIPTYMLASGLIAGGMSSWQALGTILLGNLIVLAPMLLNAHAGARYGIPFPIFVRAPFGVLGANVPAILRALVACGWFGIQTWIGGQAINVLLGILWPAWRSFALGPWVCFLFFWGLNIAVILRGLETIKFLEGVGAPVVLGVGLLLLGWVAVKAGGLGPMLSAPGRFRSGGEFFRFFVPSLTGMVGFWATVALNIPDFTRYAKSQRAQMRGQALGLPAGMTLFAFIGVAVTSACTVILGEAIWDPVALLARFEHKAAAAVALVAVTLATLNVNVAANVVSPSNDFSNLWPRRISFRTGGLITGVVGLLMMPWKLLSDYSAYIFGWLVGYSALLGPVAGIMIVDYYLVRRRELAVEELYLRGRRYEYRRGMNWRAMGALAAGVAAALLGLVIAPLRFLYDYAWFVGLAVAGALHWALGRARGIVGVRGEVV